MPAIREGYSRRVQEKKENSINICTYIRGTILEAIDCIGQDHLRPRQQKSVLCRGISPCDSFGDAIPCHFLELFDLSRETGS